jgi:hypothetical protein
MAGHHAGQSLLGSSPKVELAVGLQRTTAYLDWQLSRGELRHAHVHPKTSRISLSRPIPEEMAP